VGDVVASRYGSQCLPVVATSKSFPVLVTGQLRLPTEPDPGLHCSFPAFARSGSNEATLKLGQAAQDREHQSSVSVEVSAQGSWIDRNFASFCPISWRRLRRSREDRARRSKRQTIRMSPFPSLAINLESSRRSDRAPLIFSRKTFSQPAAFSSASWASRDWPSVDTRA
jgi:hypothetical protein